MIYYVTCYLSTKTNTTSDFLAKASGHLRSYGKGGPPGTTKRWENSAKSRAAKISSLLSVFAKAFPLLISKFDCCSVRHLVEI